MKKLLIRGHYDSSRLEDSVSQMFLKLNYYCGCGGGSSSNDGSRTGSDNLIVVVVVVMVVLVVVVVEEN